ncbi:MAG: paraquat-inducible protein A [Nitrospirota bacterium]
MKKVLTLSALLMMIIASAVLCQRIISHSIANQRDKTDYAELNHAKYGLFRVDEWKKRITSILTEEINKLYLSQTNERELRKHLEVLLTRLIDEVDRKIREGHTGSAEGWIKQAFIDMLVDREDLKKGIPEYAEIIMHEMTTARTKGRVKALLRRQLERYFDQTYDTRDISQWNRILLRTGSPDAESARARLKTAISERQGLVFHSSLLLIALSIIVFSWFGFSRQPLSPSRYVLLVLLLLMLLLAGVTTPMIDLEAKITRMSFVLMGHPVHFEDQVLYFQSKSILDVFRIMITHKDLAMKLVGILLITFSIFFPLLKMASTAGYFYDYRNARKNPVIGFFVLHSGKWSMADVMVIAIFMSYIGFSGMISSQFDQLRSAVRELEILTTDGTALQPGYFLFLTYTLLAMFLSEFLVRKQRTA